MTKATCEVRRRRRALNAGRPVERVCPVCETVHYHRNRGTCSDACWREATSRRSKLATSNEDCGLTNDFLPADAEENRSRTPVPSPEEIAAACYALRSEVGMIWDGSDLS